MTETEQQINKQRNYWIKKIRKTHNELCFLSMEGKEEQLKELYQDLRTSYMILWRMDYKLRQERANERARSGSND